MFYYVTLSTLEDYYSNFFIFLSVRAGNILPDSAGSIDLVKISAEPISQEEVTRFVTDSSAGGVSIFLGIHSLCYIL